MVLAVVGFWVIGWIAGVPMWLQAPIPGPARVYVRGSRDRERDSSRELSPPRTRNSAES